MKRTLKVGIAAVVLGLMLSASVKADAAAAVIRFQEDPFISLPRGELSLGEDYNLFGEVISNSSILSVRGEIFPSGESFPIQSAEVSFAPEASPLYSCSLMGYSSIQGASLSELMNFSTLPAGAYTIVITAASLARPGGIRVASSDFTLAATSSIRLTPDKLTNYGEVLAFFGGTEAFCFSYTHGLGRAIDIDDAWEEEYIVSCALGRVHKAALPTFSQAYDYLSSASVRIEWSGGRGIVPLIKLIGHNAGAYNPRFTTGQNFLSHHALGAAIDLNDDLSPNKNTIYNKQIIYDEVRHNLTYTGIETAPDGRLYYNFTYSGDAQATPEGIPETVVNYLLYELAFYRAGFGWGYYFSGASDAMHFSLTESSPSMHTASDEGLRKVFAYIG